MSDPKEKPGTGTDESGVESDQSPLQDGVQLVEGDGTPFDASERTYVAVEDEPDQSPED